VDFDAAGVVLPARFLRLSSRVTIIFGRKSATRSAGSSSASATWTETPARAAAFGFRRGFIDAQGAAGDFFPVQLAHCFGRFFIFSHFDESESAWLAGLPIIHNVDASDLPERLKEGAQIAFRGLKTHIANKQILHI
jgi:hypothetical protein